MKLYPHIYVKNVHHKYEVFLMGRLRLYTMSVKFSRKEMERMEEIVSSFLMQNNVKLSIPVDVFALADSLGVDVRGAEFQDNLEGVLLVNYIEEQQTNNEPYIVIAARDLLVCY